MLGRNQRIFVGDVELIKINIVQEHIDTAQVVGRQVDFLTEEAPCRTFSLPRIFAAFSSREPEPQAGS